MFIHLGGDVTVPRQEIIAILSMKLFNKSEINREFKNMAEEEEFIIPITDISNTKSFIITTKNIYLSPISSVTLKKRCYNIFENLNSIKEEPW